MKKLIAVTSLAGGILLALVPRYILPACEYAGYSRMHCSDTAQAEYILAGLLFITGCAALFGKSNRILLACAGASILLFAGAAWVPEKFGYCMSPRMPCNYGMVPAVRFTASVCILVLITAIAGVMRSDHRKGKA